MGPASLTHQPLASVQAFLKERHELLIGGRWVAAVAGETFPVENPANESVISHVAR